MGNIRRWRPRSVSFAACLICAWLVLGCGGGESPADPDGGDGVDMALFRDSAAASTDVTLSLALADSLFDFDPTLDPSMSAEANAALVAAFAEAGLAGCGTVLVSGATVTVDYGAGCELSTGVRASGSVSLTFSKSGSELSVAMTFDMLSVEERTLDGSATFVTSDGSTLAVTSMLASGVSADLVVVGSVGAMQIDGTATVVRGGATLMLTFTGVVWRQGDCYPSAGTLGVGSGRLVQTVTFSSASASSGVVTVSQGRASREATLPPYGDCPAG